MLAGHISVAETVRLVQTPRKNPEGRFQKTSLIDPEKTRSVCQVGDDKFDLYCKVTGLFVSGVTFWMVIVGDWMTAECAAIGSRFRRIALLNNPILTIFEKIFMYTRRIFLAATGSLSWAPANLMRSHVDISPVAKNLASASGYLHRQSIRFFLQLASSMPPAKLKLPLDFQGHRTSGRAKSGKFRINGGTRETIRPPIRRAERSHDFYDLHR